VILYKSKYKIIKRIFADNIIYFIAFILLAATFLL